MSDYASAIESIPLLQGLSPSLRTNAALILGAISDECTMAKGETLYREGEDGDNTGALLVAGSVEVTHGDSKPKIVKAPELLGEMQQLNDTGQRLATVRIHEPATLLIFSWHNFVGLIMTSGRVHKDQQDELREAMNATGVSRVQELFDQHSA